MKTITKVFLILLVNLVASALFAQSAGIDTFVKKVNLAGQLTATVQAADGGYVTVSRINAKSFLVRKTKGSGQKQWERRLNFQVDTDEVDINGIAQTTDGGFILAGREVGGDCFDCGPPSQAIFVKLRPNGTLAWKKSVVSGVGTRFDSLIATPDGGFIASGLLLGNCCFGENQLLVVRVTANGDVVWKKSLGTLFPSSYRPTFGFIHSKATLDNGFIVALQNFPIVDVVKITNSGNVVWKKSLRAGGFVFQSVGITVDNEVIVVDSGRNSNRLRVLVLKANGSLSWSGRYILKVPGTIQSVSSPVRTSDGGYVVTGSLIGSGRITHSFIAKIDSSRKIAFQNTIGNSSANGLEAGLSVFATADGGFVVFGLGGSRFLKDVFVLKVNSEGVVPGCRLLQTLQFGSTTRVPFGPLRISAVNITASDDLSLESLDFGLTSVVTNHSVSTLCQ